MAGVTAGYFGSTIYSGLAFEFINKREAIINACKECMKNCPGMKLYLQFDSPDTLPGESHSYRLVVSLELEHLDPAESRIFWRAATDFRTRDELVCKLPTMVARAFGSWQESGTPIHGVTMPDLTPVLAVLTKYD